METESKQYVSVSAHGTIGSVHNNQASKQQQDQ